MLRPYQIESHKAIQAALERGVNKQLLVLPTGTGKTKTAVELVEQMQFKRTLWITDRDELVEQSAIAFVRSKFDDNLSAHIEDISFVEYMRDNPVFAGGTFKMGLIKADVFEPYGQVVMSSAQTLHRRLDRLSPEEFDCIICDEAHGFVSPTNVKVVNYFSPKLLLGLTATPFRADGLSLGNVFDEIVHEYEIRDAIRDGYLCEMDAIRIRTTTNLDSVRTLGGEFNQKDLSNEVNTLVRNNLIADSYLTHAKGRQGIFFCVDIQHALDLEEAFKSKGINAKAVSSDESRTGDRKAQVKAFKSKGIDVLINVNILSTGFDFPDTGVIGNCRPTKSKTLYLQCIGRGTRLKSAEYVNKFGQNCIVLDFVDNTRRHAIINCHELEKELDPEERAFISNEKREKLLQERARKSAVITHTQEKDERVKLFEVPKVRMKKTIRSVEPATPLQLETIARWGYDIVNATYTKGQINEIFASQQISEAHYKFFKAKGYNVDGKFISKAQASVMSKEIEAREAKKAFKK